MAPGYSPHATTGFSSLNTGLSASTSSARPGPRAWESLPSIAYGFVTYPLTPSKPSKRQSRLNGHQNGMNGLGTLREEPETDSPESADQLSDQATLEIGDEVYAFEKLVPENRNGIVWYRGYVVSSSHTPKTSFQVPDGSLSLPILTSSNSSLDEPDVAMGIFPASHVHIRDHLADAEGRLADVYARMVQGHFDVGHSGSSLGVPGAMETLREEPEGPGPDRLSGVRTRSPRGPRIARSQPLTGLEDGAPLTPIAQGGSREVEKPPPPRPSVKSSDETTAGSAQPLVDEIASALREWHPLMFKHLQARDYRLFEVVKGHIEALHLGRRQLLSQALSTEEMAKLRRDCVIRLVQGNVAQGLDIIVRHPTTGALVTVDSDNEHEPDPRSWMSAPRMYALQASLAYVNQDPSAATSIGKSSALNAPMPTNPRLSLPPFPLPPSSAKGKSPVSNTPPPVPSNTPSSSPASFFHIFFELRAFVASPCAPGETAELYFSLYNKSSGQFISEDFCAVLNHNGVSSRDPEGRFGPVRTLFRDLGERDIQDDIFLVCRIVRNGAMKLGGPAATNGNTSLPNGTIAPHRRGSEPLYKVTENGEMTNGDTSISAAHGPVDSRAIPPDSAPATYRRPFGAGVVSLEVLKKFADGGPSTDLTEYSLPIFVPTNEATFSTLHQYLISSNTKEFEQSPRAQRVAVVVKAFRGDAATIVKENQSLLHNVPITSRLGFPDVVFPGDVRNELYIKLWSGEFYIASNTTTTGRMLSRASFSSNSTSQANVQVSLEVRTRAGALVENAISSGSGEPPVSRFHSMIFYRNSSPTFGELVKFIIPPDVMEQCHIFFTFRHRSTKEKGDPTMTDRPFAFAYLPLFPDGRAFHADGSHNLVLYRADRSPWTSTEDYFGAPCTIGEGRRVETLVIPPNLGKTVAPMRDSLTIRSLLCSTKFTQNPVLLGLLSWEKLPDKRTELKEVLSQFKQVAEVEIVKFLRDIFDSLFSVLVSTMNDSGEFDDLVFHALVIVLGIVSDRRFKNFQPVLDVYIEKHFTCTTAPPHMIRPLNRLLQNLTDSESAILLRNSLKVWHYIMRFVVRARELQKAREIGMGTTTEHLDSAFKKDLSAHLEGVNKLMATTTPSSLIGTQTIALQQFPTIFPDLGQVFSPLELVDILASFSQSLSNAKGKMVMWKLIMYLQIIRGFLFENAQARAMLVEAMIDWIKPHLGRYDEFRHTQLDDNEAAKDAARIGWLETLRLSVTILAVALERLQTVLIDPVVASDRRLLRPEEANVEFLLQFLPRVLEAYAEFQMPANLKAIERTRSSATTPSAYPISFPSTYPFTLVANGTTSSRTVVNGVVHEIPDLFNCGLGETAVVFLVMILASTPKDLNNFFELTLDIEGPVNLTRLLGSMLTISTSILNNDAFPNKWLNVNVLAHVTLLKLAEPIGAMLIKNCVPGPESEEEFDGNLWFDYLHMLLKLLSSEHLVIEEFSPQKRRAVWRLSGDLRGIGASLLHRCWDALGSEESIDMNGNLLSRYGSYQNGLAPLVDQVLTLCLSHHDQLRTNSVQIIYSMILSEYQQTRSFTKIKTEVINKLDELFVSETKADDVSRAFFINQLRQLFELSSVEDELRIAVLEFLGSVDMFLELLVNVRELPDGDEFLDDKVIATLRLMNFTREIGRDEMYIKYVHQLVNVHIKSSHFVEAALTLKLHADLHEWNLMTFVDPLPDLDLPRQSSFARKETLCLLILDYLGKGGAWETAVEICQDLAAQHMEITFNYQRLSEILNHQAALLQRIVSDQRVYPSYFRVSFYGDFPTALKKQPFIYRGYDWEKFADFCDRMLQKHPNAELIHSVDEPSDFIKSGTTPYIHCISVNPEPEKSNPIFTNINVPHAIRTYYEHNDVDKFSSTRQLVKGYYPNGSPELWTEKTTYSTEQLFPTVLRRSEVIHVRVDEISPIESALLDVTEKTKELSQMHVKFDTLAKIDSVTSTNALTMALNEVVEAPPNTGVPLYRDRFFTAEYLDAHPNLESAVVDLRSSIDQLAMLIEQCLKLHGLICPEEMLPFHSQLESFFRRNYHEEISRLALDTTPPTAANRQNFRASATISARELPISPQSGASSSSNERRLSHAMTLGRGGPSLYVNSYGAPGQPLPPLPSSPHALHFDLNGTIVQSSTNMPNGANVRRDQDQPTPLQRNLAHLARNGIPGMSSALLAGSTSPAPSPITGYPLNGIELGLLGGGNSNGNGNGSTTTPEMRTSRSMGVFNSGGSNGDQQHYLLNKASTASFSTLMHPGRAGSVAGASGMMSGAASISRGTIGGRLSRFGSILRKGQ